ncbi:hypothetical protein [Helicobacter cetorum]|uniref:Uncharacterized protein n=1 Tax=Helicobacter cetorum (strain ATCC BAA-429 / MIT 00-7128) TaxID=182217 RepID=I0ELK5_HELC0|nr:hypothetical protein [Helicobacter cetorum]AFI03824.1 hypothetical protein HCW_02715 [Helicobacter cetorum MIT 00-7128]
MKNIMQVFISKRTRQIRGVSMPKKDFIELLDSLDKQTYQLKSVSTKSQKITSYTLDYLKKTRSLE